ncbi:gas vesicle protein GvpJ [Thermocatellispora tengchongensis]
MTVQPAGGPASSGLADVIDTILDKGLVIDAYARVSLIGIEVLAVEARVVVSSVDTYLRFAEAMSHLEEEMEERAPAEQVEREPLRGRSSGSPRSGS